MSGHTEKKNSQIPVLLFGQKLEGDDYKFTVFHLINILVYVINKAPSPTLLREILNIIYFDEMYNKQFPLELLHTDTVNDTKGVVKYCFMIDFVRVYIFHCSEKKLLEIYKTMFPDYPVKLLSMEGDLTLLGDNRSKENVKRTMSFLFLVFVWLLENHADNFYIMYYNTFEKLGLGNYYMNIPKGQIDGKEKNTEKARLIALRFEPFLNHDNNESKVKYGHDEKFIPPDFDYIHNQSLVKSMKNFYWGMKTNLVDELLDSSSFPREIILMMVSNLFETGDEISLNTVLETVPSMMGFLFE